MAGETGAVGALTDGTGISSLTASKFFKDFVVDLLLSGAAALSAAQIMSIGSALDAPQTAAFAVAGATIRVIYRAVLKWAST